MKNKEESKKERGSELFQRQGKKFFFLLQRSGQA